MYLCCSLQPINPQVGEEASWGVHVYRQNPRCGSLLAAAHTVATQAESRQLSVVSSGEAAGKLLLLVETKVWRWWVNFWQCQNEFCWLLFPKVSASCYEFSCFFYTFFKVSFFFVSKVFLKFSCCCLILLVAVFLLNMIRFWQTQTFVFDTHICCLT